MLSEVAQSVSFVSLCGRRVGAEQGKTFCQAAVSAEVVICDPGVRLDRRPGELFSSPLVTVGKLAGPAPLRNSRKLAW